MNHFSQSLWKSRYLLILVIPFFYFYAGLYIKLVLDDPSLRSIDPDYAYFISGLNLAEGIFKLTHIDHPGTPLQYLIAVVMRVVHLFRNNPNLAEDVLANADLYLTIVNITITLVVALALLIAGRLVFRKTGSILYAMLIQGVPLISYIWYEIIGRITPELLMPVPVVALSVLLIYHIYSDSDKFNNRQLIIMSLILGFGLSIKLTLLPLLVIPVITVKTWRSKLMVLGLTVLFFLIISFPATIQIDRFWGWVKNLFLHSGNYGSGEKNIVDIALFTENIGRIISLQKIFTYMAIILTATTLAVYLWFRKRMNIQIQKMLRVASGIIIIILAQVIIVGKHYSPHYFLPAVMFFPLLIFLFIEFIMAFNSSPVVKWFVMGLLGVFIIWNLNKQAFTVSYTSGAFQEQIGARKLTQSIINSFEEGSIKVIVTQDYGSPFPEYALHFGTVWSAASARDRYRHILGELFPDTYQYTTWDGRFIYWGEPVNQEKIAEENIPVYLYLEKNSGELFQQSIDKIFPDSDSLRINAQNLFTNPKNGEIIIRLDVESR